MMIDFVKKYSLPIGLNRSIKKNKTKRYNIHYKDARNILLFFTSEGNQKLAMVKSLQNKMEKEGKKVRCLYLLLDDMDKPDVHLDVGMDRFSPEDFSYMGKIIKPNVREILNIEYDYLIHADMESNMYADLILAQSKARCRVGKHFKERERHYELMIGIPEDKKINFLLDQVYHYLKVI